ncbi:MAG: AI-2E family transporter [Gammaproteobacteria bacterium]|nr:MAG: AI-2E family transporter [Gammaproteobacteria bacterium]
MCANGRAAHWPRVPAVEARQIWVLLWLAAGGWLLYLLAPILTPFVVSALLAYLGDPLVDRLEVRRVPRALAVTLVFCVILGALLLLLLILLPRVETQLTHLAHQLPLYAAWLRSHAEPLLGDWLSEEGGLDPIQLRSALAEHWQSAGGVLAGLWKSFSASGMALLNWLANLLLIPVLTFYLLRDWDELVAAVQALLPRDRAALWTRLARESDEVLGAFLRGQVLVMFALGVIYTTGLWMVGLDFALLIGMFAGLVSFVPYLGLIVGILVAGIASILQFQGPDQLLWVVLVFVIGQLLEGTILTPRLVGERIGLHPVAVIFAVMAGGQLYGLFGILLALPVAAVGMVVLRHLLQTYRTSRFYAGRSDKG